MQRVKVTIKIPMHSSVNIRT